jgi:hypothetical protein
MACLFIHCVSVEGSSQFVEGCVFIFIAGSAVALQGFSRLEIRM